MLTDTISPLNRSLIVSSFFCAKSSVMKCIKIITFGDNYESEYEKPK